MFVFSYFTNISQPDPLRLGRRTRHFMVKKADSLTKLPIERLAYTKRVILVAIKMEKKPRGPIPSANNKAAYNI